MAYSVWGPSGKLTYPQRRENLAAGPRKTCVRVGFGPLAKEKNKKK
jgi:hypothetical protein